MSMHMKAAIRESLPRCLITASRQRICSRLPHVESLKSQLINLQMKEIAMQSRLEDLDYSMRPDNIQRAVQFIGSPRPMDEFRDEIRKAIETEKSRVNQQLELIKSTRAQIEAATSEAEAECVRLRKRLRLVPSTDGLEEGGSSRSNDSDS